MNNAVKICPYCGEEIKAIAIRCKHCKSDLNSATFIKKNNSNYSEKKQQAVKKKGYKLLTIPFILLIIALGVRYFYREMRPTQSETAITIPAKKYSFYNCGNSVSIERLRSEELLWTKLCRIDEKVVKEIQISGNQLTLTSYYNSRKVGEDSMSCNIKNTDNWKCHQKTDIAGVSLDATIYSIDSNIYYSITNGKDINEVSLLIKKGR